MGQQNNIVSDVFEKLGEIPKKTAEDTLQAINDIGAKMVEQGLSGGPSVADGYQNDQVSQQQMEKKKQEEKAKRRQEASRRLQQVKAELEQYEQRVARERQQRVAMERREEQEEKQKEVVEKKKKDSFLSRLLNKASSEATGETMRKPS